MPSDHDLVAILQRHAREQGHRTALRALDDGDATLTYRGLWERSSYCAGAMLAWGIRPGDRVAVATAPAISVLISFVALVRLGAVVVPIRFQPPLRETGHERAALRSALSAAACRWCLVPERNRPILDRFVAAERLPAVVLSVESITETTGQKLASPAHRPQPNTAILLQFSSGSTSMPKGILLTRGNLSANLRDIVQRLHIGPHDTIFSWLPLHHDMGLVGVFMGGLYGGARVFLTGPLRFVRDPLSWLEHVSTVRATFTVGPQFAYHMLLERGRRAGERLKTLDLSRLRLMINGSEPVHWPTCVRLMQLLGPMGLRPTAMQPAYGLAENCVAVALRPPETLVPIRYMSRAALNRGEALLTDPDAPDSIASVGHGPPLPSTDLMIARDNRQPAAPGQVGEVRIRGAATTRYFVDQRGRLVPADIDGWVPTGDLGVMVDGELHVVGRTKEMFKQGGRAFSPTDIENALQEHAVVPAGCVAAFGAMDAEHGLERLILAVETRRIGDLSPDLVDAVRLFVLRHFHLQVDDVIALRRLPRTTSGKIRRVELRRAYENRTLAG